MLILYIDINGEGRMAEKIIADLLPGSGFKGITYEDIELFSASEDLFQLAAYKKSSYYYIPNTTFFCEYCCNDVLSSKCLILQFELSVGLMEAKFCLSCFLKLMLCCEIVRHYEFRKVSKTDFEICSTFDWTIFEANIFLHEKYEQYNHILKYDVLRKLFLFYHEGVGLEKTKTVNDCIDDILLIVEDEKTEIAEFFKKITTSEFSITPGTLITAKQFLSSKPSLFDTHVEDDKIDDVIPVVHPTPAPAVSLRDLNIHSMFADIDISSLPKKTGSYTDFYNSLRTWYTTKHMLTDKQLGALEKMHNALKKGHGCKHFKGSYLLYMKGKK